VAILPLKPHNTLQFNLQGGTHTLTAETNYDGKTVRGSGELVIGKSRAWFDDLSLTPKVPSVGETVTIQGALKSRHNVYVELGGFFGFLESTPPGYIPDSEMSHCERELRDFFGDLIPGDFFAFGDVYPVSNTDIEILLKGHKIYGGSEQELGKFRTRTNSQGRFALDFVLPANWFDDAMTFNSYYKVHMKLYLISKNYHEIDSVNFDDNSRPDIDFYVKP
jgi:hypothetical protein